MAESEVGRLEAVFTLDVTPLRRNLARASSMMKRWAATNDDTEASVDADISPLQASLRQASAALKRFDGSTATAKIEIDSSSFQSELNKASRDLSRFDGRKAEASVTADTSSATRSFNDLRRQLANLSRQSGNLTVDADVRPAKQAIQGLVRWAESQRANIVSGADTRTGRTSVSGFVDWTDRQSASVSAGAATGDARGSVNSLLRWIGSQSASVQIGADTSDARSSVNSLVRQIAARSANISVGAATQQASASAEALIRRIEAMRAAMSITADTDPARARIQALRASTRDMSAPLRIEPRVEEAKEKIEQFLTWVRKQSADVQIGAVTSSAQRSAEIVQAYISNLSATIDVDASTAGAMSNARQAAGRINQTTAEIDVGSDTGRVMPPVQSVVSRVNASEGNVRVGANTDPARNELNGFNQIVRRYSNSWGGQGLRVRVQSDTQQVQAQLRNLQRLANQVTDPEYRLRIDAQTALAQGKLRALSAQATALGLKSPTISVGMRGTAATTAQMLGLNALADRLDGYNIRFQASLDRTLSEAAPQMLGALEQQVGRLRIVMQTSAAVAVPAYYAALGSLPGVMSMAGTAAGALATRLGAGLVGAMGSVGSAAVLGAGALGTYAYAMGRTLNYAFNLSTMLGDQKGKIDDAKDAVKQAQAAVASATPGTKEYTNAQRGLAFAQQNLAFETRKMNAMMGFATPATLKLNAAANDLQIEFIRLGAAMTNAQAPMLTRWLGGLENQMRSNRGAIVGMVTDMNKVADSFVRTMSKGREFANLSSIFSGIRAAGVPAMQVLTSALRLFVNVFAATVPTGLKVLNMLSRVTQAAAAWSGTAAGQSKIRTAWQSLAEAGAQLGRIVRDLAVGIGGVIMALNQTGIGQSMMGALESLASRFRDVMRAGGEGRAAIVEMGSYTSPVLSALAKLAGEVARWFGEMAMEAGRSGLIVDVVNAINDALTGTENARGVLGLLKHEFQDIGPLLPPLIRALGDWFSTFALAETEMKIFIKAFTAVLEAFNSLPEPVRRGAARMLAWGFAIKTLTGGTVGAASNIVGMVGQIFIYNRVTQIATGRSSLFFRAISGVGKALKTAALFMWGYIKATVKLIARTVVSTATFVAQKAALIGSRIAMWGLVFAQRALNLAMRMNPLGLVITAAALLAVGLVVLYRRSETFRNIVNTLRDALLGFARNALNFAKENVYAVGAAMMFIARGPSKNLRTAITGAGRSFTALSRGAGASVRGATASVRLLPRAVSGVAGGVRSAATAVGRAFMVIVRFFRAPVAQSRAVIMGIVRAVRALIAPVRVAASAVGRAFMVIVRFFRAPVAQSRAVMAGIPRAVRALTAPIRAGASAAGRAFAVIVRFFRAPGAQVRAVIQAIPRAVRALTGPVRAGATAAGRAFAVIVRFFRAPGQQVRAVIQSVPRAVRALTGPVRAGATAAGRAFAVIVRFFRQPATQVRAVVRGVPRAVQTITGPVRAGATRAGRAFMVIVRFFRQPVTQVRNVVRGVPRAVQTITGPVRQGATRAGRAFAVIVRFFMAPVNRVRALLTGLSRFIGSWAGRIGSVLGRLRGVVARIVRFFSGPINRVRQILTGVIGFIGGWVRRVGSFFARVGSAVMKIARPFMRYLGGNGIIPRILRIFLRVATKFLGPVGLILLVADVAVTVVRHWDKIKAAFNASKRWLSGVFNAFKRFAGNVGRSISSFVTSARRKWDSFWTGVRNLWDRSLSAIRSRTDSWRNALRNLFDRFAKWVRSRWDSFWSGLRNLWDNSLSAIRSRTDSWRDALRSLFDRFAKWIRSRWDSFWSGLRGLWDRALSAIRSRTDSWRDAFRRLVDNIAKAVRSRFDSFWSGMRNLWDTALSKIGDRARSWGQAIKSLFKKVAGWMTSPIENARDTLKGIWNGILGGIGKVLGAVGLKDAAKKVNGAKWAAGGTTADGGGQAFANGGTTAFRQFANGGMGTSSKQPRVHMWNEQMGHEAYITERGNPRDQMRYLSTAASWHNASVVPHATGGVSSGFAPESYNPPVRRPHRRGSDSNSLIGPNSFGGKIGGEGFGRTTFSWSPLMQGYVNQVRDKFPVSVNTYTNHPGGEKNSADAWAPGGRGRAINKGTGDSVASWIQSNVKELNWMIWAGRILHGGGWESYNGFGGPHHDHVHWTAGSPGKALANGKGGGFFSVWERLGEPIWNRTVGKAMDGFRDRMKGGHVLRQGTAGAATLVTSSIKDWLAEKFGSSGGGAGSPKQVKEWIRQGLPLGGAFKATDANVNKMAGRAMQESGGDPSAINGWDSNAKRGTPSKGLFQIIKPTWNSHSAGIGGFDANWNDPVKSTAVASRYMKSRYGSIVGRSGSGYARGGVIPGPTGAPRTINAHAGERVIPANLNAGFESLAASVDSWNNRGATAPSVNVADSHRDFQRLIDRVDHLTERVDHQTRTAPRATGAAVKDGVDYNLEHDRSTRERADKGSQKTRRKKSMSGRRV